MNVNKKGKIVLADSDPCVFAVLGDSVTDGTWHRFGIVDARGREFGARVDIVAQTYGEVVSKDEAFDGVCLLRGYSHGPYHNMTIYKLIVHAQRDGVDYGASHNFTAYHSREAAEKAAQAYITAARKRAENHKAAVGTIEDGYRWKRVERVVTPAVPV